MTLQLCRIYLDHPKVGCGWRSFVVLKTTRTEARLLCVDNAVGLTIPLADLAHAQPEDFKARRLIKRIKATALAYHKEDSWAVKKAVKALKQQPAAH